MGFSGQEYWSGSPFPSPGDLPDPGIEPASPVLQEGGQRCKRALPLRTAHRLPLGHSSGLPSVSGLLTLPVLSLQMLFLLAIYLQDSSPSSQLWFNPPPPPGLPPGHSSPVYRAENMLLSAYTEGSLKPGSFLSLGFCFDVGQVGPHLGGSEVKASACNVGDLGLIPGSGRSPGEGNGNPLQYSCLENPMDGEAWWATVHGVAKNRTRLSDFTFTFRPGGEEMEVRIPERFPRGKGNNPEHSLERLVLKLQRFGHLMRRANLLEKTLMLGKIEGRRRRGRQRMRWLDGITDLMDMGLSKVWETVKDWCATVHGVPKSWRQLSN